MGLHSRRPVRVLMLTPVHRQKHQQWACEHQNLTTEQWKKVALSDESRFLLHHVDGRVRVRLLSGEHMAPGCTMGSGSSEVHALTGQGCFGSKRGTNTTLGRWS
ncbi:hypothetical protein DPX16_21082 [Anabarilius grahami]|uniref:Uncharacterized protein n=1 Tax=Anabarilius grahami TaxID=495550 RepID=A0A3N0ZAV1_ANAGA|nr:hypothetical protein DPX16_21082 [Anabarilius grahami]